ncbi:unnamed protein product [Moneuplotes crassus]|uniref:Uncharacterized protein n=1 Tax=Euplotes crassus TaxID=5936 RepID=A0AAD1YBH7_EUPCR|nr:unnamed protein product [Moneuplotes crassus]
MSFATRNSRNEVCREPRDLALRRSAILKCNLQIESGPIKSVCINNKKERKTISKISHQSSTQKKAQRKNMMNMREFLSSVDLSQDYHQSQEFSLFSKPEIPMKKMSRYLTNKPMKLRERHQNMTSGNLPLLHQESHQNLFEGTSSIKADSSKRISALGNPNSLLSGSYDNIISTTECSKRNLWNLPSSAFKNHTEIRKRFYSRHAQKDLPYLNMKQKDSYQTMRKSSQIWDSSCDDNKLIQSHNASIRPSKSQDHNIKQRKNCIYVRVEGEPEFTVTNGVQKLIQRTKSVNYQINIPRMPTFPSKVKKCLKMSKITKPPQTISNPKIQPQNPSLPQNLPKPLPKPPSLNPQNSQPFLSPSLNTLIPKKRSVLIKIQKDPQNPLQNSSNSLPSSISLAQTPSSPKKAPCQSNVVQKPGLVGSKFGSSCVPIRKHYTCDDYVDTVSDTSEKIDLRITQSLAKRLTLYNKKMRLRGIGRKTQLKKQKKKHNKDLAEVYRGRTGG